MIETPNLKLKKWQSTDLVTNMLTWLNSNADTIDGIVTRVTIQSTGYTFTPAESSLYAIFTGRVPNLAGAYLVYRYSNLPPEVTPILNASSIVVSVSGNSVTIKPSLTTMSAIVKLY